MITQEFVDEKLREIGPSLLNPKYRATYNPDLPTTGYCYIVTEAFFHFGESNTKPYCISYPDQTTHWFLKGENGIIDYTVNQFGGEDPEYERAVCRGFFKGGVKTERGWISKRGYEVAKLLGLVEEKKEKGSV